MKVNTSQLDELNSLMVRHHLKKNSDVIKVIILKINEYIVQNKKPEQLAELRNAAAVYA
ncbi:hypothetical protein [Klebsiella sp. CN_Kp109]|uniref:hypothetical protein n=1 Tax=Klebsiella sp. CN_Kp109 TaxID=3153427 RepID=UPI0032B33F8D